jgi:hypothetical protein
MNWNAIAVYQPKLLSLVAALVFLWSGLTGCSLPQVSAEERLFLDLSLEFLDAYELPVTAVSEIPIGGLSSLTYDRERDRFYVISDDRSYYAPARFYTLRLTLKDDAGAIAIDTATIENVTTLTQADGEPYPPGKIDAEGIALSPRHSVFISSEGSVSDDALPFINEFDLETGQWRGKLPIPERYLPQVVDGQPQGIQDNRGFESLTLNPGSSTANSLEPFRLFVNTESNLAQDVSSYEDAEIPQPIRSRLMHYLIGDPLPTLLSEHLYLIDPPPEGQTENGLTDILALDQAGHFLSLERSFGLMGFGARIFQMTPAGATDTSGIPALAGDLNGIVPILKQLVLDLNELEIPLDNLEGMGLGPRLPDGSQSLILMSDNNFNELQINQFLLFRLRGLSTP